MSTGFQFFLAFLVLAAAGAAWAAAWLWRTPLVIEGTVAGSLAAGIEFTGEVRFRPFSLVAARPERNLLSVRLYFGTRLLLDREIETGLAEPEPVEPVEPRKKPGRKPVEILAWLERHYGVLNILEFLLGTRRFIRIETLRGRVTYGFEDPALTGEIFGYYCAARDLAPVIGNLEIVPQWMPSDRLEGSVTFGVGIFVLKLLAAAAWFAVSGYRSGPPLAPVPARAAEKGGIVHAR